MKSATDAPRACASTKLACRAERPMPSLLLRLALLALGAAAAAPARPHVIMMLADDWGSYDASYRQKELGRALIERDRRVAFHEGPAAR